MVSPLRLRAGQFRLSGHSAVPVAIRPAPFADPFGLKGIFRIWSRFAA
jgi:hypothetical protein